VFCLFPCSIDASSSNRLAKFVNDSPARYANCKVKAMHLDGKPHLILFALKTISAGTELRYDYGTGNRTLEWRRVRKLVLEVFCLITILVVGPDGLQLISSV